MVPDLQQVHVARVEQSFEAVFSIAREQERRFAVVEPKRNRALVRVRRAVAGQRRRQYRR